MLYKATLSQKRRTGIREEEINEVFKRNREHFVNIRVLQPMNTNLNVNIDFYINPLEYYYHYGYGEELLGMEMIISQLWKIYANINLEQKYYILYEENLI
jgi:hypothetical protein